ncbi:MAG: sulfotransferase family protein, partial [Pirellulaceae bacterium]|nr:sulfotransferase family protein [Pirellulaceae bacterium]
MDHSQITIVTGLPRSGTSMMMKMLEAGGVPPLADHRRAADLDNPNGYYEFEPVKRTKEDPSWLSEAEGRA